MAEYDQENGVSVALVQDKHRPDQWRKAFVFDTDEPNPVLTLQQKAASGANLSESEIKQTFQQLGFIGLTQEQLDQYAKTPAAATTAAQMLQQGATAPSQYVISLNPISKEPEVIWVADLLPQERERAVTQAVQQNPALSEKQKEEPVVTPKPEEPKPEEPKPEEPKPEEPKPEEPKPEA
jgi:hypothetical protein